jgi:hypothetical protein
MNCMKIKYVKLCWAGPITIQPKLIIEKSPSTSFAHLFSTQVNQNPCNHAKLIEPHGTEATGTGAFQPSRSTRDDIGRTTSEYMSCHHHSHGRLVLSGVSQPGRNPSTLGREACGSSESESALMKRPTRTAAPSEY